MPHHSQFLCGILYSCQLQPDKPSKPLSIQFCNIPFYNVTILKFYNILASKGSHKNTLWQRSFNTSPTYIKILLSFLFHCSPDNLPLYWQLLLIENEVFSLVVLSPVFIDNASLLHKRIRSTANFANSLAFSAHIQLSTASCEFLNNSLLFCFFREPIQIDSSILMSIRMNVRINIFVLDRLLILISI